VCGIAGIFRPGRPADDGPIIEAMLARMVARGPDADGAFHEGPVHLGHRRLAILDVSEAGRQPMQSASGRFVITYNGEIYNFAELRAELGLDPAGLRSGSDTEILLAAWERWGPEALQKMVGQWAFALYDRREERLWLARDRFGEKPLFYHRNGGTLCFASSLGALIEAPWVPRELARDALEEFVALRYVVAPRTVLREVEKLPAGCLLEVDRKGAESRVWYRPRFRSSGGAARKRSADDLCEEFGALLVGASQRCLVSDVPVALLLSDGVDSNAIRWAMRAAGRHVPAFTFLADQPETGTVEIDPAGFAAKHYEIRVAAKDRLASLEPAFAGFTEPVGDGASLATWLLIRGAREHATVFVCGHGADEVLGGYRLSQDRFRLGGMKAISWLWPPLLRALFDSKTFGAEPPDERQRRFRSIPWARVPEAARYLIHRPLPYEDVRELMGGADVSARYLSIVDRLYEGCAGDASGLDRIQEVMMRTFLGENILSYADSVSMDSSAELRLPFLDRDLVEFVFGLPGHLRASLWPGRANTKRILRLWGEKNMPREVAHQRKRSFPYGSVREILDGEGGVRRRLLDSPALVGALPGLEKWLEHPQEYFRGPWESAVWSLLGLGIWADANGVR
jgi:asparagine synthase (glutamine-hydrolysing)